MKILTIFVTIILIHISHCTGNKSFKCFNNTIKLIIVLVIVLIIINTRKTDRVIVIRGTLSVHIFGR